MPILLLSILFWTGCTEGESNPTNPDENITQPQPTPGKPKVPDIEEQTTAFAEKVFPDFQPTKMDPMDAFPVFQTTSAYTFRRLQRKKPIDAKVGRTYPRILLKSYLFPNSEDLEKEVTIWLNGLENSADTIVLGQAVEAVKTPPLLCGITAEHFWMVQAACIYETPEWEADKERFFAEMKARKASYAWEVKCGGGKLEYVLQAGQD